MTKIDAARIIEEFTNKQVGMPIKYREITPVEELALRKAVKTLRRSVQNEKTNNP